MKLSKKKISLYNSFPKIEINSVDNKPLLAWEKMQKWYSKKYGEPSYYIKHPPVLKKGKVDIQFLEAKMLNNKTKEEIEITDLIFKEKENKIYYKILNGNNILGKITYDKLKDDYINMMLMIDDYLPIPFEHNQYRDFLHLFVSLVINHQYLMVYISEFPEKQIIEKEREVEKDNNKEETEETNSKKSNYNKVNISETREIYVYEENTKNTRKYRRKTGVWLVRGHYRNTKKGKVWIEPHLRGPEK